MTEIVLAVPKCALAVLPRFAPVNRREHDEPVRRFRSGDPAPFVRVERAPLLERMSIGGIMVHTRGRRNSRRWTADDVRFSRMEIAAGRVHAERPARSAKLFPRRQPERVSEDVADGRVNRTRPREQRALGCAVEMAERIGLRRPIEIAERPGEPIEMVLGTVVVGMNLEIADFRLQISD
jgi:hypothetical protein